MDYVQLPNGYFPHVTLPRPISNGSIYVGINDTDPEVVTNQITVSVLEEDGSLTEVSQPVSLSAGGVPTYGGSPVTIVASSSPYSIKVLDSAGSQVYYIPSISGGGGGGSGAGDTVYYPSYNAANHSITGDSNTVYYYATQIGTTDKATIFFRHNSGNEFTDYSFGTILGLSSYKNIKFVFEQGARIKLESGIVLTLPSPKNIDAGENQQIFTSVDTGYISWGEAGDVYESWYGLVGDGTTDDTDLFYYMSYGFVAGTRCYLSAKTFILDGLYYLGNTEYIGHINGTILMHKNNGTDHMIASSGSVLTFKNITFDGNYFEQTVRKAVIHFSATSNGKLTVKGCKFIYSVAASIYVVNADYVDIQDCTFTELAEHGGSADETSFGIQIATSGATTPAISILNNRFYNPAPSGNTLAPTAINVSCADNGYSNKTIILDNIIDGFGTAYAGNQTAAIEIYQNVDNVIISNNVLRNSYFSAIRVNDSYNSLVNGNTIDVPAYAFTYPTIGVNFVLNDTNNKYSTIISNNNIKGDGGTGIAASGNSTTDVGYNVIISGNNIYDAHYGVNLSHLSGTMHIDNNNILTTASHGIYVTESSGNININNCVIKDVGAGAIPVYIDTDVTGLDIILNSLNIDADSLANAISLDEVNSVIIGGCNFTGTTSGALIDYDTSTDRFIYASNVSETAFLSNSTTWDPSSVSVNGQTSTTLTVTGAALGDIVLASFSLDLQGLQLTAYVSAADTVTAVLTNNTGGAINLASGTLAAGVFKVGLT